MPECPHCHEELDCVDYSQRVHGCEWGYETFPLGEGNTEVHDSENSDWDDLEYTCPHCDRALSDTDIEELNAQYRERQNDTVSQPTQRSNSHFTTTPRNLTNADLGESVECPHCHHLYQDEIQPEMICPRCNKEWEHASFTQEPEGDRLTAPARVGMWFDRGVMEEIVRTEVFINNQGQPDVRNRIVIRPPLYE